MKYQKTTIVLFLITLFVAGWLFQTGRLIESTFLTNDYHRKLFQQVDLTPYAREMMQEEMLKSIPLTMPDKIIDMIATELSIVYDRQWLEKELLVIIDDLLMYIKGKRQPPQLHINLTEKNEQMREMIRKALHNKRQELPLISFFNSPIIGQSINYLVDCIPFPAYYDLNVYFSEKGVTDDIIGSVNRFKNFRRFYLYFPVIAGILCLAFFFFKSGLVKTLKYFGGGMVIAGITFLLAMLARRPFFLNAMERNFQAEGISELAATITAIELAISKSLHIPVFVVFFGLVLFLAGLLIELFALKSSNADDYY